MKPVLLIAANFVRENRWPLLTLLLYVVVFGGAAGFLAGSSTEDVIFFLRSVGVYGLAFAGLLSASAINNERRSRRILAVLSKAIEHGQYLAGLLGGGMLASAIYCVAIGLMGSAALARHGAPVMQVWSLAALLMASFLLVATAAMFFATFLHPLLAAACAAVTLGVLGVMARTLGGVWMTVLPSFTLVDSMVNFSFRGWHAPWAAAGWAVMHAAVFWVLATMVFSRRDIALAVE